ncbi:MAG: ABC transporter ATP-binding protein [Actinomycetota bacterium]
MSLLALDRVGVSYGVVRALHSLTLEVNEGEVVALLGANGAGKSSTLRAISGVARADRGTIHFAGKPIHRLHPERIAGLGIAHLPEGRGIFPTLTVRENLEMGAYGAGLPRRQTPAEVERVTVLFPILRERVEQLAGTLSGGQQQMLAVARALISRPRLLMLDELSFGLAPTLVQELFAYVAEIARQGTAILLVEQFVTQALGLASRAYVLEKGQVVFEGSAHDLKAEGSSRYYLGHEEHARGAGAHRPGENEAVTLGIPGGLWRDLEISAAAEGRRPDELLLEALQGVLGDGQRRGETPVEAAPKPHARRGRKR